MTSLSGPDNFIVGQIEGDPTNGVAYVSSGADYAEWLRKQDPGEEILAGDVVGLIGDTSSKIKIGADGVMVVSTGPVVVGNDPGNDNREGYARVASIGQAWVKVDGIVNAGDYLCCLEGCGAPAGKWCAS